MIVYLVLIKKKIFKRYMNNLNKCIYINLLSFLKNKKFWYKIFKNIELKNKKFLYKKLRNIELKKKKITF